MEIEDIPAWVPEPVRRAASVYGAGHPLVTNFLSDPRMEAVWLYIQSRPIIPEFLTRLPHSIDIRSCNLTEIDHANEKDRAFASIFYTVLVASNNSRIIAYRKSINVEIRKLDEVVSRVEGLRRFDPIPMLRPSEELEQAIQIIIDDCKRKKELINNRTSAAILEVVGRPASQDNVKVCVREVGTAFYAIYGNCMYGMTAKVANAMFRPAQDLTDKTAENWCTKHPLPIMLKREGETS